MFIKARLLLQSCLIVLREAEVFSKDKKDGKWSAKNSIWKEIFLKAHAEEEKVHKGAGNGYNLYKSNAIPSALPAFSLNESDFNREFEPFFLLSSR